MIAALFLLQTALTLGTPGSAASPEYLAVQVAQSEGLFAAEGLSVMVRSLPGEAGAAKELGDGKVDLAATSLDEAIRQGHAKGVPPKLVFGLSHVAPVALLVPAAQAGAVRGVGDLAGKTVGIPAPGSPEHGLLVSLLARGRVPVPRVVIQSMGGAGLARAIAGGTVAAAMIGEPWATELVGAGSAIALVDFRRPGAAAEILKAEIVHAAVFAPAQSRVKDADLVAVDRALLRALERLRSAPAEELASRLGSAAGKPDEWPARLAAARAVLVRDGAVSADMVEASLDLMKERGPLPAKVQLPRRLSNLIASEPLRQALGGK